MKILIATIICFILTIFVIILCIILCVMKKKSRIIVRNITLNELRDTIPDIETSNLTIASASI